MAQDIICRPWKGIKGPWVCLMSKLYLFCYVLTSFFLNFLTSKRHVENKVVAEGTRTAGSCSVSVTLFCKVELTTVTVAQSCPWNSPGQNTGVGSCSLLQGIFLTQRSNPGLLHCRWILYHLSHRGSPRILEWVAYPFSRGSSWPRNQTGVSGIAGRFFTNWATREANLSLLKFMFTELAMLPNHLTHLLPPYSPVAFNLFQH